ncbi:MAG TPA: sigma-70 family RNA polymerase sigma factor [Gemmataceae bacterium]|nr:sigma-70 family RNA polymerase sigma factor [Gemmataceae bacterium]
MTADPLNRLVRTLKASVATDTLSDADLLARVREPDAVEALVRRHGPRVLAACRTILGPAAEAEDAFQATFLVLLRNPTAVRQPEAVGAWLYGTARRIALQARKARRHTANVPEGEAAGPDLSWREAVAILYEELDRLPAQFRKPLTLCYLDGLARDEAAVTLGCSLTTVKGRLERGREALRKRLTKRGISLSAGLLAAAAGTVSATCPSLAPVASPAVKALARGAGRGSTIHAGFAVGLAASIVLIGVTFGMQPPAAASKEEPKPVLEAGAQAGRGRVLDGNGKPVVGASVYWVGHTGSVRKAIPPQKIAVTARDGTFSFDPEKLPKGAVAASLVAAADGWAPDWRLWKRTDAETTLRLVPDAAVKGRLLDLEGRPVAGATVRVQSIAHPPGGDWAGVANAFRLNPEWLSLERFVAPFAPLFMTEARTDADGRFQIKGVGIDRVVQLRFLAPAVESANVYVITSEKFDLASVHPKGDELETVARGFDPKLRRIVYGASFEHAARPSHDIIGTVTDRATGKPVVGVKIVGTANVPDAFGEPHWHDPAEAVTDKDGRYRLTGLPKAQRRFLHVRCDDVAYLDRVIEVKDVEALKTASADIQLDPCLFIDGVLTDKVTGKPVIGEAKYLMRTRPPGVVDRADTKAYRNEGLSPVHPDGTWAATDEAGRFRLRVPHGAGLVLARADTGRDPAARYVAIQVAAGDRKYLRPHNPAAIDAMTLKPAVPEDVFDTGMLSWPLHWENGYAIVDAKPGETVLKVTIPFDPGLSVSGAVVGPDGNPVAGCQGIGLQATDELRPTPVPTDRFTAAALAAGRPRTVYLVHEAKGLVGTLTVQSTDKDPVVKMQPWGVITGRVVMPDGTPAVGAEVSIQLRERTTDELIRQKLYKDTKHVQVRTDAAGRFRLDGQFPGIEVGVFTRLPGLRSGAGGQSVTPRAGEVTDVGDITLPAKRE